MSPQWYHYPHKPRLLMIIILGSSPWGLFGCRMGLGQKDIPPRFCICNNCVEITTSSHSNFATETSCCNLMCFNHASLYVTSPIVDCLILSFNIICLDSSFCFQHTLNNYTIFFHIQICLDVDHRIAYILLHPQLLVQIAPTMYKDNATILKFQVDLVQHVISCD